MILEQHSHHLFHVNSQQVHNIMPSTSAALIRKKNQNSKLILLQSALCITTLINLTIPDIN